MWEGQAGLGLLVASLKKIFLQSEAFGEAGPDAGSAAAVGQDDSFKAGQGVLQVIIDDEIIVPVGLP